MPDLVISIRGEEFRVPERASLSLEMPISVDALSEDGRVVLEGRAVIRVRWEGGRLVIGSTEGPRVVVASAIAEPDGIGVE